jgi:hypothetical protein
MNAMNANNFVRRLNVMCPMPKAGKFQYFFALAALFLCLGCPRAYGDVGVILNESLDTSMERITGSGHTAVYFSRICPDSPIKLRLCRPGERGSVLSNYINLGEDERFEWNIAPLTLYVYGVQDPRFRPIFGSQKVKGLLEEKYRQQILDPNCATESCISSNKAEWREMVGAGMTRSMYFFVVGTTLQQDLDIIAKFNSLPNENHFNGMTRNCADFVKDVVNTYFPHSAHRDPVNDFGMTSPKAVARTFTHYALDHPEMNLRVIHFSQLPGTFKRSSEARSGTEQLYHSKKLLIPMVIFADYALPVAAATYALTGRFNPEHQFEAHPAIEDIQNGDQVSFGKPEKTIAPADEPRAVDTPEIAEVVGTSEEWKDYRKEFDSIVDEAVHEEVIPNRGYLNHFFKRLDEQGTASIDSKGAVWMEIPDKGATSKLGVSENNIFASGSDSHLAYELLLARVSHILKSPKHSRETMLEFKQDWALLQYSREKNSAATSVSPAKSSRSATMLSGGSN